ncbi:DUF402 domain-containing protein [Corynebacterium auriscanis]|uniref:DUF402 domain-containing protein n=1 Tax=Corynebacterium auriscanis TaxID=99807 RepID=UPI003CF48882
MHEIDLHPIKTETFDIANQINIDPKGNQRHVDRYEVNNGCLYMGRVADHPDFSYLESWLLPEHNLRVSRFHFREGFKPSQELYVDIALITQESTHDSAVWTTRDLYVDLVSHNDGTWDLLDLDELGAAVESGYITAKEAATALITTQSAIDGISTQGFAGWIESLGVVMTWPVWEAKAQHTGNHNPS